MLLPPLTNVRFPASGPGRRRIADLLAATVQYGLLFGFAAVAASISAHGLTGFACTSMAVGTGWCQKQRNQ
jgi:hypothetical protein